MPAALTFTPLVPPLTSDEDAEVAFAPIVRLPLTSFTSGGTIRISYVVPSSPQWDRIRKNPALGDNGYIAFVADPINGQLIPFTPLGIEMSVTSGNAQIPLTRTDSGPYLYPSKGDAGLRFAAQPGSKLQIAITARRPETLPEGEFLVQPYWYWNAQDIAELGRPIDGVLRSIVMMAARIGLTLLAAGVVLQILKSQILKS